RAAGRLLHHAEALSERGFLFRPHLSGDGLSRRDVLGPLCDPANGGLDRPVGRNAPRSRAEDRAAPADLHGRADARLRSARATPVIPVMVRSWLALALLMQASAGPRFD